MGCGAEASISGCAENGFIMWLQSIKVTALQQGDLCSLDSHSVMFSLYTEPPGREIRWPSELPGIKPKGVLPLERGSTSRTFHIPTLSPPTQKS